MDQVVLFMDLSKFEVIILFSRCSEPGSRLLLAIIIVDMGMRKRLSWYRTAFVGRDG
jgi:hypothetical protein